MLEMIHLDDVQLDDAEKSRMETAHELSFMYRGRRVELSRSVEGWRVTLRVVVDGQVWHSGGEPLKEDREAWSRIDAKLFSLRERAHEKKLAEIAALFEEPKSVLIDAIVRKPVRRK